MELCRFRRSLFHRVDVLSLLLLHLHRRPVTCCRSAGTGGRRLRAFHPRRGAASVIAALRPRSTQSLRRRQAKACSVATTPHYYTCTCWKKKATLTSWTFDWEKPFSEERRFLFLTLMMRLCEIPFINEYHGHTVEIPTPECIVDTILVLCFSLQISNNPRSCD